MNEAQKEFASAITNIEDVGKEFKMNPIGVVVQPCYQMQIEEDDRILGIDAESDGVTLRRITVHLLSGKGKVYGGFDGPWNNHPFHRFDFSRKLDLLGIYGLVR